MRATIYKLAFCWPGAKAPGTLLEKILTLPYRLCAIDLDDTLLGADHQLSAENEAVIRDVVTKGVKVVLASGRMFASSLPTALKLNLDTPIVCYNGAMVKHPVTKEVWHEDAVSEEVARDVMEYCREKKLQLNFYYDDILRSAANTEWLDLYLSRTSSPFQVMQDFYTKLRGLAPTKLIIVDDPELILRLLPELTARYGDNLFVTRSNAEYLELLPPNANKGSALAKVAERYGITAEESMAFGDSWNDIPMLEWAGLGIAVSNAKKEVLAVAKKITGSNAENGVGSALKELFS